MKNPEYVPLGIKVVLKEVVDTNDSITDFNGYIISKGVDVMPWEIRHREKKDKNIWCPLDGCMGWLCAPEEILTLANKEFVRIIQDSIKYNNYTIQGVANSLFALYALNSHSDETFNNSVDIIILLNSKEQEMLLDCIVKMINDLSWMPKAKINRNPSTLLDWEALSRSVSYASIDSHLSIFIVAVSPQGKRIPLAELVRLAPIPRMMLHQMYGLERILGSEEVVECVARNSTADAAYIASLPYGEDRSATAFPSWYSEATVAMLIKADWESIGREILRRSFGVFHRNQNQMINNVVKKAVIHSLVKDGVLDEFSSDLAWPAEYESIAGICKDYPETVLSEELSISMIEGFIQLYSHIENKLNGISGNTVEYGFLYSLSPFEVNTQFAVQIMIDLLLKSNDLLWDSFYKQFNKTIFALKPYYYGDTRAIIIGKTYTEFMLLLALSAINIDMDEIKSDRLKALCTSIDNNLVYPYLRQVELEYQDYNGHKNIDNPYDGQKLVVAIISEFIINSNNSVLKNFLKRWEEYACLGLPWNRDTTLDQRTANSGEER